MMEIETLAARRETLQAEIERLQQELSANTLDQAEAGKLEAARAALAQVEQILDSTRASLSREDARKAYKAAVEEQRKMTARQRELSAKVAKLRTRIVADMNEAKPMIREHQELTAKSRSTIERLYSLAGQAGGGLDPMKDIDANECAPIDPGFVRLLGLG